MADINLNSIRKNYPQYKDWSDERLTRAINKKMAAEASQKQEETKGFSGIGQDIASSLESAPQALAEMVTSIPGAAKNVGRYALTTNPVSTVGNAMTGAVESTAGLLSAPQMLTRYLSQKFPNLGRKLEQSAASGVGGSPNDPTLYEGLMNFERAHGLAPQSEEEASVRGAGGLLLGGKVLTKLPSMLARTGAVTAEQAGRGGDPVHAAILGITGDLVAKAPWKKAADLPQATWKKATELPQVAANTIKNLPEIAGTAASTGLDTMAGLGSAAHIPAVPSLMETLSDYIKYKSIKPETLAQRKLFKDIEPEDMPQINERMEAAKRLGLGYLTPAEATLSPYEAAKQGTIGRTSSGSKLLFQKGMQRTASEGTAINNLLDTIYNEKELEPQKKAAYDETMKASVPQEFIQEYKNDPVIEEAIKKLHNDPAYRKSLGIEKPKSGEEINPLDSFEYWDHVKRVLGDMEEANDSGQGRQPFKKSVIAKTRRDMVADMDAIKPEYEVARGIAERQFTRKKLEDVFDKKSMTINNFKSILGSKKSFNDVMNKLKAYPDAQQMLNDMKLLFGDTGLGNLIPNDMSIRSATALKRTSMSEPRNKLDAMKQALDEKYGKEHDVATINLMTDPDWLSRLSAYIQNQKGSK